MTHYLPIYNYSSQGNEIPEVVHTLMYLQLHARIFFWFPTSMSRVISQFPGEVSSEIYSFINVVSKTEDTILYMFRLNYIRLIWLIPWHSKILTLSITRVNAGCSCTTSASTPEVTKTEHRWVPVNPNRVLRIPGFRSPTETSLASPQC